MIYLNNTEYKVKFYKNSQTGESLILEYIENLNHIEKAKILKYIEFLREHNGYLDEPYSRHIKGKIRELRVDFSKNRFRVFYFIFIGKTIILLHVFLKKSEKTPIQEIKKAEENYCDVLNNSKLYE
jgi:phage-related protein